MARRKTTRRRRSTQSFKILNALEALAYGQIISVGVTGGGLSEFVTGKADLTTTGADVISLSDFASEPTLAIAKMSSNFRSNIVPMATASLATGLAFNVGRRVLRRPINNINRNIMKPLLGAGIKL